LYICHFAASLGKDTPVILRTVSLPDKEQIKTNINDIVAVSHSITFCTERYLGQ